MDMDMDMTMDMEVSAAPSARTRITEAQRLLRDAATYEGSGSRPVTQPGNPSKRPREEVSEDDEDYDMDSDGEVDTGGIRNKFKNAINAGFKNLKKPKLTGDQVDENVLIGKIDWTTSPEYLTSNQAKQLRAPAVAEQHNVLVLRRRMEALEFREKHADTALQLANAKEIAAERTIQAHNHLIRAQNAEAAAAVSAAEAATSRARETALAAEKIARAMAVDAAARWEADYEHLEDEYDELERKHGKLGKAFDEATKEGEKMRFRYEAEMWARKEVQGERDEALKGKREAEKGWNKTRKELESTKVLYREAAYLAQHGEVAWEKQYGRATKAKEEVKRERRRTLVIEQSRDGFQAQAQKNLEFAEKAIDAAGKANDLIDDIRKDLGAIGGDNGNVIGTGNSTASKPSSSSRSTTSSKSASKSSKSSGSSASSNASDSNSSSPSAAAAASASASSSSSSSAPAPAPRTSKNSTGGRTGTT